MANRKATIDNPHGGQDDEYERDLRRDNRRQAEGIPEVEPQGGATREPNDAERQFQAGAGPENYQKDRKGQAQSPVELNLNQPEKQKKREGR